MEFINRQISFTERVVRKAAPSAIVKLLIVAVVAFATNSFALDTVSILVGAAIFAMIIFGFYRDYKDCINWIEVLIISENKQTCTLRLMQKDNLYKELALPVSAISCKQKVKSRGREGNVYYLEIYSGGEFIFELSDVIINRYKQQEIIKYFELNGAGKQSQA